MQNLQSQIENRIDKMVADVLVLVRSAAIDAVNNALNNSEAKPPVNQVRGKKRRESAKNKKKSTRRTTEEIQNIADDLYKQIEDNPGEQIIFYKEKMGLSTKELDSPMRILKREERVKSTGERNEMRYFPMANDE